MTRREMLGRCGMGAGLLSLATLMGASSSGSVRDTVAPLRASASHFKPRAKRLIHFFLNGGLSHVDSLDYKPALEKYAGKPLPYENLRTERKTGAAFPSPFKFRPRGQSGLMLSDLFPKIAEHADELCVIRSMKANLPNHEPSLMLMNCGDAVQSRPSLGSWLTYGLGTENENLPGFVAMCPNGYPIKEAENWQSGFLPGSYQGTYVDTKHQQIDKLIENIRNTAVGGEAQRRQLELLRRFNRDHQRQRASDPALEARIQAFELAYRMQMEAADAFDLSKETPLMRAAYGDTVHGRQTLIARRLLERGVRCIQLWHGAGQPWDNHNGIEAAHRANALDIDQPVATLLTDLRERGMLDDTLVLFTGEFGRTPTVEMELSGKSTLGRDHNPYGFSLWMAGGGVKPGYAYGTTDEFGFKAEDKVTHVHDLHATILWLMGFDHERLTYRYAGRDFRLTDVHGHVAQDVIA
ncbi:MAG: DUF1501 domain-containing protein [Verrucomicrobia bacterium]|nr:DUF1501 domain-containing protein [Verrucomicrobiota bacterium]